MCDVCETHGLKTSPGLCRRSFFASAGALAASVLASPVWAKETKAPPKPQNVLSPAQALDRLMAGNKRYTGGTTRRHDFAHEREALVGGQNPFAGILSCADSRIAPEYAFDTSRGDLFVVRVAGNFLNADNLASFEYAVEVLKTPLLVVLGHEACGAIKATISSIEDKTTLPGHLPSLVAALTPAVEAVKGHPGDMLDNATRENISRNVAALKSATPLISAAVEDKRVNVVGGLYHLGDGRVELCA
jgi:carbonic anhydrase